MTAKQNITAIIYDKKGRVLSVGRNSYIKTHTRQAQLAKEVGLPEKTFLHAEVSAILKLKYTDKPYRIFVSRVREDGSFALAMPCPICERALDLAGIKKIEWTIS